MRKAIILFGCFIAGGCIAGAAFYEPPALAQSEVLPAPFTISSIGDLIQQPR